MTHRKTSGESEVSWHLKLLLSILLAGLAAAQPSRIYQDPRGRFEFRYPAEFGSASPGTDNGFRDRAAAVRFSDFSAGIHAGRLVLGGEAVLTSGPPRIDLQAAGGLYDPIGLQIFPESKAAAIRKALPLLTAATLCDAIGREQHLDPGQEPGIAAADRMGNAGPRVSRCEVSGDTVLFAKESSLQPGGPSRHIYGAVRFLPPPYSTFQLIRGGAGAPGAAMLQQVADLVRSWTAK
jgi:hypothetical protein